MKKNNRLVRINEEYQKEITEIIRTELKDPRITAMTTVMSVDMTQDMKFAKVFISVLGDKKQKDQAIKGLKNASGFIRKELARRVNLRNTPELLFHLDETVEYAIKMSKLIDEVNKNSSFTSDEMDKTSPISSEEEN